MCRGEQNTSGRVGSPYDATLTPVMYENQRGLSLWGKTWYSSNSLLPTDPSPFTLPLVPVGGAIMTRDGEEEATEREGRIFSTVVPKIKRKSINCGYNLETFQTPSPSWVWITPWMVKMRTNTDEQGWRYNLWFHRKGWRSHAAPLNWWGWVRRRAWVRLRGLIPHEEDKSFEKLQEDAQEDDEPLESFDEVFDSGKPLLNIIRHLATFALDREKQGAWDRWLEKSSKGSVEKLKDLLKTPSKVRPATTLLTAARHHLPRIHLYPVTHCLPRFVGKAKPNYRATVYGLCIHFGNRSGGITLTLACMLYHRGLFRQERLEAFQRSIPVTNSVLLVDGHLSIGPPTALDGLKHWVPAKVAGPACRNNVALCPSFEENRLLPRASTVRKSAERGSPGVSKPYKHLVQACRQTLLSQAHPHGPMCPRSL